MSTTRDGLTRWMTTAALLGALGLPLAACAQTAEVEEAQAPAATEEAQAPEAAVEVARAGAPEAAAEPTPSPEEAEAKAVQKELEQLQTEARVRQARLQSELAPLQEEKTRLEAEIALLRARQQSEQTQAMLEQEKAAFKQQLEMAQMQREMEKVQTELKLATLEAQLDAAKRAAELADANARNQKLATEAASLQAELARINTQRSYDSVARDAMQYPAQPLKDGVLTISDRRIPLNGPIGGGTADYVTERIHYFNNLNAEAPIFIVIDSSPGGSVMEGYRIVTAMQNSDAPVHVVVKSFAASMAACITTLAEESYCYPNAIILHHQMSSSMRGNLTQQKESLEDGFEWAKRLANPVADKMGVSYDEFVKQMYKNNSDGDWAEFGDNAQKLKWVNHVVENIRETALISAPNSRSAGTISFLQGQEPGHESLLPQPLSQWDLFHSPIEFGQKTDGNGKLYTELPPLQPFDYYFMYDPDQQYRMAK